MPQTKKASSTRKSPAKGRSQKNDPPPRGATKSPAKSRSRSQSAKNKRDERPRGAGGEGPEILPEKNLPAGFIPHANPRQNMDH